MATYLDGDTEIQVLFASPISDAGRELAELTRGRMATAARAALHTIAEQCRTKH
jgi:hypothetical protein